MNRDELIARLIDKPNTYNLYVGHVALSADTIHIDHQHRRIVLGFETEGEDNMSRIFKLIREAESLIPEE